MNHTQAAGRIDDMVSAVPWQGSGTVLVTDDDLHVLLLIRAYLIKMGFNVLEASSGNEALKLYEKHANDIKLVITDICMPVMDGHKLFNELRKLRPDLPIIITTGFWDTGVIPRFAQENTSGFLSKPYIYEQVRAVVMKALFKSYSDAL